MKTTRREVLAAGALGAAAAFGGPLLRFARAEPDREISVKPAVITLFLRGGQDALNTLVPYADGRYYDLRPSIAIPQPSIVASQKLADEGIGGQQLSGFQLLQPEVLRLRLRAESWGFRLWQGRPRILDGAPPRADGSRGAGAARFSVIVSRKNSFRCRKTPVV